MQRTQILKLEITYRANEGVTPEGVAVLVDEIIAAGSGMLYAEKDSVAGEIKFSKAVLIDAPALFQLRRHRDDPAPLLVKASAIFDGSGVALEVLNDLNQPMGGVFIDYMDNRLDAVVEKEWDDETPEKVEICADVENGRTRNQLEGP